MSDGLKGISRLTSRVSYLMFGSDSVHRAELDSDFRAGSIIIPLHFVPDAIDQAETLLASRGAGPCHAIKYFRIWVDTNCLESFQDI